MEKAANKSLMLHRLLLLLILLCGSGNLQAQEPILERKVTLDITRQPLQQVLNKIEIQGRFSFSYNPRELPLDSLVSISVSRQPVKQVLDALLKRPMQYRVSGSHLILLPARSFEVEKSRYIISGYIENSRTGERIPHATVYHTESKNVALTDQSGYYELAVSTDKEFLGLGVSKQAYFDTVLVVKPLKRQELNVKLLPQDSLTKLELRPIDPEEVAPRRQVEEIGIVKLVVPERQMQHSRNLLSMLQDVPVQMSFIPSVSTNSMISGSLENNLSLNLISGYSFAVKGLEAGGILNIVRQDVTGVQAAGFGNVVGGRVRGLQAAGFFNNLRGSFMGIQAAGFSNVTLDTIWGLQAAGFSNVVKGKITGVQAAGFSNVSTQDVDGIQFSGFSNVAAKDVNTGQVSGFFNYGRKIAGAQVAGFTNVASGDVAGVQVSGFSNVAAQNVAGVQVSGFLNIAAKDVDGTQISGFANYAGKVTGTQIGFLNLSDSVGGVALGFLSFSLHGFHEFELYSNDVVNANLAFKTGGNRHFYNIFTGGMMLNLDSLSDPWYNGWSFGYGVGSEVKIGRKWALNLDLTASHINERKEWLDAMNVLGRLDMHLNFYITKQLVINAGPAFNVLASQYKDYDGRFASTVARYPVYEWNDSDTQLQMWVGWHVGIRL